MTRGIEFRGGTGRGPIVFTWTGAAKTPATAIKLAEAEAKKQGKDIEPGGADVTWDKEKGKYVVHLRKAEEVVEDVDDNAFFEDDPAYREKEDDEDGEE